MKVARDRLLPERQTDTLHDWTPLVPTPALDLLDGEAVRKLTTGLPTGECLSPSGLRSDHLFGRNQCIFFEAAPAALGREDGGLFPSCRAGS